jgi:hypothetical protein
MDLGPVYLRMSAALWRAAFSRTEHSEGKADWPPAAGAACRAHSEDDRAEARS